MLKFLIAGVVHSQYLRGGQKRLDTKVERQARVVRPRSTRRYSKFITLLVDCLANLLKPVSVFAELI